MPNHTVETSRIDLNEANAQTIADSLGLNRDLSQAIVSYRQREGRLKALAELLNVPGFDSNLLKNLRPRILI